METEEIELSKIEKVKNHFKENKKFYIGAATGFVVGAIFVTLKYRSTNAKMEAEVMGSITQTPISVLSRVTNNATLVQTISPYGNPLGRPGKAVVDITTGKRFESEKLAAISVDSTPSKISDHLHGREDHVNGHIFIFVTDASTNI